MWVITQWSWNESWGVMTSCHVIPTALMSNDSTQRISVMQSSQRFKAGVVNASCLRWKAAASHCTQYCKISFELYASALSVKFKSLFNIAYWGTSFYVPKQTHVTKTRWWKNKTKPQKNTKNNHDRCLHKIGSLRLQRSQNNSFEGEDTVISVLRLSSSTHTHWPTD